MFCINCGAQQPDGARFCASCGHSLQPSRPAQFRQTAQEAPHTLPEGTLLRGRYRIGKVLGQGGFGITYLGTDTLLEVRVAIKEFYPSATVYRDCSRSLSVNCNDRRRDAHYQGSKARFLREAKALVKFRDIPEVVDILDFVEENNTAYIVMEYVQGMSLAKYIAARGGRLTVDETFTILKPVMLALAEVHKSGIVHRDIAPDNIILHPMGGAKLLDFGAVREVENADADTPLDRSTEAILKHGFAPIEQYNTRGSLGPWTDEYALCATVYYCLTGNLPPEAALRVTDGIEPDWESVPGLAEHQITALDKGMALRAKDRYPDMEQLVAALFGDKAELDPAEPAADPVGVSVPAPAPAPVEHGPAEKTLSAPEQEDGMSPGRSFLGFLLLLLIVCAVVGAILLVNGSIPLGSAAMMPEDPVQTFGLAASVGQAHGSGAPILRDMMFGIFCLTA